MRPRSACALRPSSSGGGPASVRVPPAPRCCALAGHSETAVDCCQSPTSRPAKRTDCARQSLVKQRTQSMLCYRPCAPQAPFPIHASRKKSDDPVVSSADSLATSSTLRGLPGLQAAAGHAGQAPRGARDAARGRRRGAAAGGARGASRAGPWCCRQRPCVPAARARGQGGLDHRARPGAAGRVRRCGPSLLQLVVCITIG